ncbi:hypothetical protein [Kitasatospora sp. NBC_01302]|uniref:hypothetical protein n=1 Tax=Kitasatospora sp. NBC_01302 TaxID=2903575 RepID=UPI002E153BB6|nr:hypothetical protein OG294_40955 [Kitasatospora sp. NBC_01302]
MTTPPKTRAEKLAERLRDRNDDEAGKNQPAAPADPPPPEPAPDKRTKFQAYVSEAIQNEARAVVYWTNNRPGGYASLTEMAEAALQHEIERMREQFTKGEPFRPMPEGRTLPTRPPGS